LALPPPPLPGSPATTTTPAPTAAARHLGRAGLLPFVAAAAVALWGPAPWQPAAAAALTAYAAVIVSFLGGIHWGLAMRHYPQAPTALLAWGVVPSLLAWPALLLPPAAGLAVLGASLLLCYAADRKLYPPQGVSAWLGLRAQLTAVASVCCWAAAAAQQWARQGS
jgi:hypothetical protein